METVDKAKTQVPSRASPLLPVPRDAGPTNEYDPPLGIIARDYSDALGIINRDHLSLPDSDHQVEHSFGSSVSRIPVGEAGSRMEGREESRQQGHAMKGGGSLSGNASSRSGDYQGKFTKFITTVISALLQSGLLKHSDYCNNFSPKYFLPRFFLPHNTRPNSHKVR